MNPPRISIRPRAFTLIELLVVVGILALLAALLFPVLGAARENARATTCRSQLRQIAMALQMYADENNGSLPPADTWDVQLLQFLRLKPPLSCPDVPQWRFNPLSRHLPGDLAAGYAFNEYLAGFPFRPPQRGPVPLNWSQIRFPASTVAFSEAKVGTTTTGRPDTDNHPGAEGKPQEAAAFRHRGGANYAFMDGHVRWYRPEAVDGNQTAWQPDGSRPSFKP